MDIEIIIKSILELGFPIVACIGLFWFVNKQNDQHKTEMTEITKAINNNTLVIQQLIDKMESDKK